MSQDKGEKKIVVFAHGRIMKWNDHRQISPGAKIARKRFHTTWVPFV